jgi:hypothetical protein
MHGPLAVFINFTRRCNRAATLQGIMALVENQSMEMDPRYHPRQREVTNALALSDCRPPTTTLTTPHHLYHTHLTTTTQLHPLACIHSTTHTPDHTDLTSFTRSTTLTSPHSPTRPHPPHLTHPLDHTHLTSLTHSTTPTSPHLTHPLDHTHLTSLTHLDCRGASKTRTSQRSSTREQGFSRWQIRGPTLAHLSSSFVPRPHPTSTESTACSDRSVGTRTNHRDPPNERTRVATIVTQ